jgi:hypothetical protein
MAFVQDFLDVRVGFDAVVSELLDGDRGWLPVVAEKGVRGGQELRLRLAPRDAAFPLPSKRVRVDLERPYRRGDGWVLPFHWAATVVPAMFPAMEAELTVAPLGNTEARLTFSGRYQPPLGAVGQVVDTVLLHRVVERSVRSFLVALGDALQGTAGPAPVGINSA